MFCVSLDFLFNTKLIPALMKALQFNSEEEELKFLRNVLDRSSALINVIQIDDFENFENNINLWANRGWFEYSGYSLKEYKDLGVAFFGKVLHPDDITLMSDSVSKLSRENEDIFGGFVRVKSRHDIYNWFAGTMSVIETRNGLPWRFLTTIQNIENMKDTQIQILQLIRENLQLKHQLVIKSLSPREKQIIGLIASGQTDKEIAAKLSISPATVKTHRHNIIQKLNLKNKAQITQLAAETGLI